jgi:NAD(P)-dependent dehydrogenase (short-subunit alcohol dehydrogenase family)
MPRNPEPRNPQKRIALVTGGNRGIGLAIVRKLAESGHRVFLGSRDAKAGAEAAEPLRRIGLEVFPLPLDLSVPESLEAAFREIGKAGGPIEVLVNNAGVLHEKPLLDLTDGEIADSIAAHITGPIRLIRLVVPGMRAGGFGRIVNMSSGWGSFAEGLGPGAYGITKAALNALTVRLADELPPAIKVNAMCPGWVRTRMGGPTATRSPEAAADTAIWLATLPEDGPTGGFFRDRKPIKW